MTRKYFGTDGIRGRANEFPMTADMAVKVAMAAADVLRAHASDRDLGGMDRVVIGKDTRLSGYMLEQALCAGFTAMGMEAILTGPVPTPAVAMLTRSLRADMGVMISASHNPYQDNGIKLFGADGYKLPDALEAEIEAAIDAGPGTASSPDKVGKASRLDDAPGRYIEFLKSSLPRGETLKGLKIVVDCAHGAAYKVAPMLLWELEAEVVAIGDRPDGRNINRGVGATATENLQEIVAAEGADIGVALDGDADRLIVVDEKGARVDGDQLMGLLALEMKARGALAGDALVATVMSNLGLERKLEAAGIGLIRTQVGDRYVVEAMKEGGYTLGGEQSGHIILSDFGTTGDGLLAALQVLSLVKKSGKAASEALSVFNPVPQHLENVKFNGVDPLNNDTVRVEIERGKSALGKDGGRLLIRKSGTEPLIRVMAEHDDRTLIERVTGDICRAIAAAG